MKQSTLSLKGVRERLSQREHAQQAVTWMIWITIGVGIVLRLAQFIANRSLWLDESYLALNIAHRSFAGLMQPLDYGQAAPVGFLLLEKLFITMFGNSDLVLRLAPLIFGIASLFVFRALLKRYVGLRAQVLGLALFVAADSIIYYASELKQYSSDVTVVLALALVATIIYDKGLTIWRAALFAVLGAAAIWFSYPATFALAGLGTVLFVAYALRRDWRSIITFVLVGVAWATSFVGYYLVSLRNLSQSEYLRSFWDDRNAFMPLPPKSPGDVKWFFSTFFDVFQGFSQFPVESVLAVACVVGLVALLRKAWLKHCLLLAPIAVTLLVSGLQKYTISERTTLFFLPLLLVFAGMGLVQIYKGLRTTPWLANAFLLALLLPVGFGVIDHLVKPREKEELKPVMSYLANHRQPGDTTYLYYSTQYAFKYYQSRYGFTDQEYVAGKDPRDYVSAEKRGDLERYITELDGLRGKARVWLVFSHSYNRTGIDEETFFINHLNTVGKQLESFKRTGASVYLYDLSK